MAKAIETLSIQLKFQDAGSQAVIEKVKGSLKRLEIAASGAKPNIKGLRDEILAQGRASIKSVSNINAQRNALLALRDEAKIGGETFKKLTADIKKLDAQLGKTSKKSGGMGARRATQTAGAIISGGIFGGPEGAIGGALGALGGVEGAFAGAAIGAQIGMLRQSVGEMANYAASIEKAKIALSGILPNQNDYNFALQVAGQATRELNVPQEQSIRGITRLSAAVTGAGGPVQDAATTFRNVTAAIKATGGSSEDVQGAITAMVQVFSKGKVSAEELSGQLGERLPGAVTLFAKANKMTLPELQKNLKAGTVGLNELMNFIVELGNKYNATAKKISDSNAEAGAKLAVAVQDMQAAVGAALIPIGAQFQAAFAEFIREITPHLVTFLPKIGNLFLALAKNLDTLAVAAIAALGVLGAAKFVALAKAVGLVTGAVTVLKGAVVALGLANPFTALAVGAGILAGAIYNASKEQKRFNLLVKEGTVAQVDSELAQKQKQLDEQISRRLQFGSGTSPMARSFQEGGQEYENEQRLRGQIADLRERRRTALIDANQGADLDLGLLPRFKYDPVTEEDGGDGDKSLARRIEQAQKLEQRSAAQLRIGQAQGAIGRLLAQQDNQRAALQERINKLLSEGKDAEVVRATNAAKTLQSQALAAQLQSKVTDLAKKALKPFKDSLQAIKDKIAADKRYEELIKKGINPERAKEIVKIEQLKKKSLEHLDVLIDGLRVRVAGKDATQAEIDLLDQLIKKRQEAEEVDPEEATKPLDKAKTEFEQFQEIFKKGLEDMMNVGPKLANVALEAITGVADGLVDMIATGQANFKKFASEILKDIAKIMMRAALANAVKSIFNVSADGNVIQSGQIKPYAKGGIVAAPTLFPMKGNNIGVMGEAGPEAILPLRRGPDGRLGVENTGASRMNAAMSRYSRNGVAPGQMTDADGMPVAGGMGGGSAALDVRYNVERINNVDYVTAAEFEQGMTQAAKRGAELGRRNVYSDLVNKRSIRSRVAL
jgi:lambda family phage tail tape measure protein